MVPQRQEDIVALKARTLAALISCEMEKMSTYAIAIHHCAMTTQQLFILLPLQSPQNHQLPDLTALTSLAAVSSSWLPYIYVL